MPIEKHQARISLFGPAEPQPIKRCPKCCQDKRIAEFASRSAAIFRPTSYCRSCQRSYCKAHYGSLKHVHNLRRYQRQEIARSERRRLIDAFLRAHRCVDCGQADVRVLEFDHVRGDKGGSISDMIYHAATATLLEEMKKCDVRCANCHRRKTARQFGWRTFESNKEYADVRLSSAISDQAVSTLSAD